MMGSLLALAVAAGPATATIPETGTGGTPGTTINVTPSDNLDGFIVNVIGAGFTPGSTGKIFQCRADDLGACASQNGFFDTSVSGGFVRDMPARPTFDAASNGAFVDCRSVACVMYAVEDQGGKNARHHLTFFAPAPPEPAPPPTGGGTAPPAAPPASPAPPATGGAVQVAPTPQAGVSVLVAPVSGTVLFRRPGSKAFERLTAATLIPDRSEFDTRKGVIQLTAAAAAGATQTIKLSKGLFIADQNPTTTFTQFILTEKLRCPKPNSARAAKAKKRSLFGDGKAKAGTKGSGVVTTVRGTKWLTTDYCDRSEVRVTEGVVSVRDLFRKRTVTVRARGRYVARRR